MDPTSGKLRVLIVDDSNEDRTLYKRLITQDTSRVYEFIECDLGEEGLMQYRNHKPNCVLLDYNLPDISGLEFLGRLVGDSVNTFSPIVMLTGQGNEKVAVEAMKCGAQDYLIKGLLTPEGLRLAIENAMGRVALQRKARELESVKADFLSTASHELRTPLTIIREFVALVLDGVAGPITLDQTDCLSSALQNCDRLSNLINDILDLRRIEAGDPGLRRAKIDLRDIIENCRRDFVLQCEKRRQTLKVECANELPMVLCDPDRTTQVLVNLMGNAHKFTPDGGEIFIKASVLDNSGKFVRIEIRDTGPGINREDQEKIFEKFTQLGRQHGPGAKGTGLGLAIVKNIISMHGGSVSVDSVPGQGCAFAVTFPIHSDAREAIAFLEDQLLAASAAGAELSVVALKPENSQALFEIEQLVLELLRHNEDATLSIESENILIITAQTSGSHATELCTRIVQAIEYKYPVASASITLNATVEMPDQFTRLKSQLEPMFIDSRHHELPGIVHFAGQSLSPNSTLDRVMDSQTN